jgi:hypothetical protein
MFASLLFVKMLQNPEKILVYTDTMQINCRSTSYVQLQTSQIKAVPVKLSWTKTAVGFLMSSREVLVKGQLFF